MEYSLPGNTVSHKNVRPEELGVVLSELITNYNQVNLITTAGDVEYKISKSGKEAILGADKLLNKLTVGSRQFESAIEALDVKKNRILSGSESFLISLGISDKSGRVHDKKQGKYRQINRFLEHIEDVYDSLPKEGELLIYDLCCGKSYLSFAVYYYLTVCKSRRVRLVGIDLKRDVIAWCSELASKCGFVGMRFIYDDVKNTPEDERPDMVISLHACDVATDIVIDRAIELRARVILSTPCCHRYLNDKISRDALGFITRYPHLRNKLAEAITDAIRASRLEKNGYSVSVLELTDPDDTPKNTLIRAILKDKAEEGAEALYDRILDFVLGDKKSDYLKEIK
jgi:SAM-dependent methyltransferase